jgi:hypothetical protein
MRSNSVYNGRIDTACLVNLARLSAAHLPPQTSLPSTGIPWKGLQEDRGRDNLLSLFDQTREKILASLIT